MLVWVFRCIVLGCVLSRVVVLDKLMVVGGVLLVGCVLGGYVV